MKVLTIGGAGYIGSRLVPELMKAGHDVVVVDQLWFGNFLPPSLNFMANASAPAHAAYIAKKAGVRRFVYADSCSVYGFTDGVEVDEKYLPGSTAPYGISKLQGGLGVLQLVDDNFSTICLRQGTLSGYSPRMRFDLFINTMYMKAMMENKIVVNNPVIWRPLLAMTDAVKCYIKALEAPPEVSGTFN